MKELLEAGVHFGHQTKRWNPKMKDFIFGQRNGIYIIDLQKTIRVFKEAINFIQEIAESGKEVLMVGTKKQAQDIIKDYALQCEVCYVNQRWLGGLLTNFNVVRGSVDRLIELEEMKEDGRWDLMTKKEQSKLDKVYKKLSKNIGGIKTMMDLPGAMFVIDSTKEDIAIAEAKKLGIPIVAVVDTNGDPENIDYPIPGNDDAVRAIELFSSKITEAVMEGKKSRIEKELLETKEQEEEAVELTPTEGAKSAKEGKKEPEVTGPAEEAKAESGAAGPETKAIKTEAKEKTAIPSDDKPEVMEKLEATKEKTETKKKKASTAKESKATAAKTEKKDEEKT